MDTTHVRDPQTNYLTHDAQGGIRGVMDSNGMGFVESYDYNAFGDIFNLTGTTENRFRYTGQQYDDKTGLYFLRARYYDPAIGRFLSQDAYPVNTGNPMELNRYVYTANNPVNFTDPSGLQAITQRGITHKFLALAVIAGLVGIAYYINQAIAQILCYLMGACIDLSGGEAGSSSSSSGGHDAFTTIATTLGVVIAAHATSIVINTGVDDLGKIGGDINMADVVKGLNEKLEKFKELFEKYADGLDFKELVKKAILTAIMLETLIRAGGRIVYRNPFPGDSKHPSEHPTAIVTGFWPTGPGRIDRTIDEHVQNKKPSPFISVTKSLAVAKAWQRKKASNGLPIYVIDLNKIVGLWVDLTTPENQAKHLLSPKTRADATASEEIVVAGWIPPWAIMGILPI